MRRQRQRQKRRRPRLRPADTLWRQTPEEAALRYNAKYLMSVLRISLRLKGCADTCRIIKLRHPSVMPRRMARWSDEPAPR
jgi:hypothetical protein